MPAFSLIVLSYQSAATIERCLDALSGFDAEIILADNGSTDIDLEALRLKYPGITVLALGRNYGFAEGNNRAVRQSRGEWLGFINPDAFAGPQWLDAMCSAIASRPDVSIFTSMQIDAGDARRLDGLGDRMTFFGFPYRAGFGRPVPSQLKAHEVFSPCGAAFVIRRSLFLDLGGFDDRFFCYCEDSDLGFRARLRGEQCWLIPEAVVSHIGSASSGVRSNFALYHGYRNRIWLYAKNMPLLLLVTGLPVHIGMTLIGAVADIVKGKGRIVLRALGDALAGMGPILSRRKNIQSSRQISALRLAKVLTWNPWKIFQRQ